jgi:hypothetical protein
MKTLTFMGEEYEAERIVKTNTDIIGYNGNSEAFSFKGISDFSYFQLAEGEEWDTDLSPEARILALEEALLMLL